MKSILLLATLFALNACSKETKIEAGTGPLLGVWVEKNHRQDSLHVYRSGDKTIMFDNSPYYRMSGRVFPLDIYFRHEILLQNDSIGFRPANAPSSHPFFFYFFRWDSDQQFTMSYNGIRPYLSSIGTLTYEKVRD
jgi:hypothetical protein